LFEKWPLKKKFKKKTSQTTFLHYIFYFLVLKKNSPRYKNIGTKKENTTSQAQLSIGEWYMQ
jgi:hypothetical protein